MPMCSTTKEKSFEKLHWKIIINSTVGHDPEHDEKKIENRNFSCV